MKKNKSVNLKESRTTTKKCFRLISKTKSRHKTRLIFCKQVFSHMVLSIPWHWISSLRLLNIFFSILRLKHLYFLITKVIYTGNFSNVGIHNNKSKNSCNSYPLPHLSPCFLLSNGYILTHTVPHVFMCLADTHTQNRITREV